MPKPFFKVIRKLLYKNSDHSDARKTKPAMRKESDVACTRLSVSAEERKRRASSGKANKKRKAGREKGRACKRLFKYLNQPTTPPTSRKETVYRVKMRCQNVTIRDFKGLFTWMWVIRGRWRNPLRWVKIKIPFSCNLTTPPSRGALSIDYWMVAKHVNKKNAANHVFWRSMLFNTHLLRYRYLSYWCKATPKVNFARIWCIMNPTPARRVIPPWNVYTAKFDSGWEGYPFWQTGLPALAGHPT